MTYIGTRRGTQPRLWTPRDLGPGLGLWLDGTDRNTIVASAGKVATWFDKSEYGNHLTQSNTTLQPLDNNPPAVQSTTGTIFTPGAIQGIPVGTSDRSIFSVSNTYSGRNGVTQFQYFWGANSSTSAFGFSAYTSGTGTYLGDANSKNIQLYNGSTYYGPAGGVVPAVYNTTQMISVIASNQNAAVNVGGVQKFSGAMSYNTGAGGVYVFKCPANNAAMQGFIFDIIILNVANANATALVEGYLAWKRGLVSSLPATHQFKLQPPRVSA